MSQLAPPFFSVITPTYNSEAFISVTLRSILSQTYSHFEIIISDDGSSDRTLDIVETLLSSQSRPYRIIKGRHRGPGGARNAGIAEAQGEWLAFLDSDDTWFETKLEKVAQAIQAHPDAGIFCHAQYWHNGTHKWRLDYSDYFDPTIPPFLSLYRKNCFGTSAVVTQTALVREVGLFDETLPACQDYDLWIRVVQKTGVHFIRECLGEYTVRPQSVSSQVQRRLECHLRIQARYAPLLKTVAQFPSLEERKFKGYAHLVASLGAWKIKHWKQAIYYGCLGMYYWPFRTDFLRRIKKLLKGF